MERVENANNFPKPMLSYNAASEFGTVEHRIALHAGKTQLLSGLHEATSEVMYPVAQVTEILVPVADSSAEGTVPLAVPVLGQGSSTHVAGPSIAGLPLKPTLHEHVKEFTFGVVHAVLAPQEALQHSSMSVHPDPET